MDIWITRPSINQIMFGGLERLRVWFREPHWYSFERIKTDSPFGEETELCGWIEQGWTVKESGSLWIEHSYSFGKMFGYGESEDDELNKISTHVWDKLTEHFGNLPFTEWEQYEKDNAHCNQKHFKLKLSINISLK